MASLDSVRCKIFRAKEHCDAFVTTANRHFEGYSTRLMVEVNYPQNTVIPRFDAAISIPAQLPLIIGDCIQNIRSSLDYLVWELALATDAEPSDKHAFPICETPDFFGRSLKRGRLGGLSDEVIEEIEMLQPYKDGEGLRGHPFWVLDKLCNINKHRRILLTGVRPGLAGYVPGSDQYAIIPPGPPGSQMNKTLDLVAYIAFEEGEVIEGAEVCSIVTRIIEAVERVLPNFDRFFS
jgi:hypothetical protein